MEVKCLTVHSRDLVNGCDYCLYFQQTVCRLGRCGLQQSPPQPVKMLKLLPDLKYSRTLEWKGLCRRVALSLSLSLSHTFTHLCTHYYIELQLYLYQGKSTQAQGQCGSVVEMRLQPTETIGLGLERVRKRSKYCGQGWQDKSRTTAGNQTVQNHMAVRISPVNFTSQFYILPLHMSTTEATQC